MKLIVAAFLIMLASPLACLVSYGYSPILTIDTINPAVILLSPIEGNIWLAGMEYDVVWEASDSNLRQFPVKLLFSNDNGLSWQILEEHYVNTGLYNWMTPYLESNQILVRIEATDSFGNTGEDQTAGFFSIVISVPASPRGVRLEVVNQSDIHISWDPVTEDVWGNPHNPDGYIVLYSSILTDLELFNVLSLSETTDFLHENATLSHSMLFYAILAYKDIEPITSALIRNRGNSSKPLQWKDIKRYLNIGKP